MQPASRIERKRSKSPIDKKSTSASANKVVKGKQSASQGRSPSPSNDKVPRKKIIKSEKTSVAPTNKTDIEMKSAGKSRSRSKSADRGGKRIGSPQVRDKDAKSKSQTMARKTPLPEKTEQKKAKTLKKEDADEIPDLDSILEAVKPTKSITAYIFFNQSRYANVDQPINITEMAKESGKIWQSMTDAQKKPFITLAEKDKRRFAKETEELEQKGFFTNSDGVKSTDLALSKPKFKPHVVMPKKIATPYQSYIKMQFKKFQAANPDLKMTEISKLMSSKWMEQMSDKEKKPYFNLAEDDRQRYDREYEQLITQGYFVTADGVKSHTLKKKVKRVPAVPETAADVESESSNKFGAVTAPSTSPAKKAVKRSLAEATGSYEEPQVKSTGKKLKKQE